MSWSKKVTVGYYTVEAAEDDYFENLYDTAEAMLAEGNAFEMFEAGELRYMWKLYDTVELPEGKSFLFSLIKERKAWPVWFADEGKYDELTFNEGTLGDISYGLVNTAHKFLISFAAGAGGGASSFKKMLGRHSAEGVVRLNPLYEQGIDERVMNWDSYKKLSLHLNMPSGEDVTNFQTTNAGELMKILGHLGGMKLDISVSAGGGKELLSNMMVKDLLPELLANDLCTSLTVRGSDFESGAPEQFDLKNAQIKYTETVEVEGNYITESEAKQILMRALNARSRELFAVS